MKFSRQTSFGPSIVLGDVSVKMIWFLVLLLLIYLLETFLIRFNLQRIKLQLLILLEVLKFPAFTVKLRIESETRVKVWV